MIKLNYKDYLFDLPESIYFPSDDTDLILSVLENELSGKKISSVLELGTGNLFLSLLLYDHANHIIVTDIDDVVIVYAKDIKKRYHLGKLKIVKSNLFENISEKFDLIVFNPPYVPSEKIEVYATDGGIDGVEVIDRFISQLEKHMSSNGVCYLLISSFNKPRSIYRKIIKNNLTYKKISSKLIFFEELIVLKINVKPNANKCDL